MTLSAGGTSAATPAPTRIAAAREVIDTRLAELGAPASYETTARCGRPALHIYDGMGVYLGAPHFQEQVASALERWSGKLATTVCGGAERPSRSRWHCGVVFLADEARRGRTARDQCPDCYDRHDAHRRALAEARLDRAAPAGVQPMLAALAESGWRSLRPVVRECDSAEEARDVLVARFVGGVLPEPVAALVDASV